MLHKSQWGAGGIWTPTPEFQPSYTRPIFSSLSSPHFSLSSPPPPQKKKKKKKRIYAFAEKKLDRLTCTSWDESNSGFSWQREVNAGKVSLLYRYHLYIDGLP